MSAEIRNVKIVVLGDPGVGKSAFVNLLCHGEVLSNHFSTVGCNIEVKLHEYSRTISSSPTSFFVEFWDVGGSLSYQKGRNLFYSQANGVILVHDLTNRKSHSNLTKWLYEFYDSTGSVRNDKSVLNERKDSSLRLNNYDPEQFADRELPLLVVGTREDQVMGRRSPPSFRGGNMAAAMSISLNCTNKRQFTLDSKKNIELMKFLDKVIDHKYYPSLRSTKSTDQRTSLTKRHSLN